jgi:hypothetical protein
MDIDINKELDTEFGKFLSQLDLERNSKKQVLFVQGDYFLRNAVSFYQYILDQKKLVTLIGEYHNLEFGCNKTEVNIADYCLHEVTRNSKCLVLLEYNSGDDPRSIHSTVINQVWAALDKAGKKSQIFPYDYRPWFLSGGLQGILYSNLPISDYAKYIDPFYLTKLGNGSSPFDLVQSEYTKPNLEFMYRYFAEINREFDRLVGLYKKNKYHTNLRPSLKKVWAQVCDYFILAELLKANDRFDNFIIISGEHHRENLSEKLALIDTMLVTEQKGTPNACVNLFQTYYI